MDLFLCGMHEQPNGCQSGILMRCLCFRLGVRLALLPVTASCQSTCWKTTGMTQIVESLSPRQESWAESLAPSFSLAQPWPLHLRIRPMQGMGFSVYSFSVSQTHETKKHIILNRFLKSHLCVRQSKKRDTHIHVYIHRVKTQRQTDRHTHTHLPSIG